MTVSAAWRIDARMIAPESITVPSRSKRTTGKRTAPIVATEVADASPSSGDEPWPKQTVLDRPDVGNRPDVWTRGCAFVTLVWGRDVSRRDGSIDDAH